MCPCRRNGEPLDPQKALLIADCFALRIEILEVVALSLACVTRLILADVAQSSFLGRFKRAVAILTIDNLSFLFANVFCGSAHVIEFGLEGRNGPLAPSEHVFETRPGRHSEPPHRCAPKFLFHLIALIKLLLRLRSQARIGVRAAGKTKPTSKKGSLLRAKALRRRREEASPKLTLNPNLLNQ